MSHDKFRLDGRTVVISGAARGLGAATAAACVESGAKVAVFDVEREQLDATTQLLRERGGEVESVEVDVTDRAQVQSAINHTVATLGDIWGVFCAAGVNQRGANEAYTEAFYERVVGINLKGTYNVMGEALPLMRESGGGSIVTISSVAANRPGESSHEVYAASKGGVLSLSRAAAVRWGKHGIRINTLSPGYIATDMTGIASFPTELRSALDQVIPLGRPGDPEEVAWPAVFLMTDAAQYLSGMMFPVDGGADARGGVKFPD